MKFLIRDLDTGLFYCSPARWVGSWTDATDFGSGDEAVKGATGAGKSNMEVFVVDERGVQLMGRRIGVTA